MTQTLSQLYVFMSMVIITDYYIVHHEMWLNYCKILFTYLKDDNEGRYIIENESKFATSRDVVSDESDDSSDSSDDDKRIGDTDGDDTGELMAFITAHY